MDKQQYYDRLYAEVFDILGELTPLARDCGTLCDCACCKGGDTDGMLLFPYERTELRTIAAAGGTLAVCDGTCDRSKRPLACRLFPLFPLTDERGRITVGLDARAMRVCPIAAHSEQVIFDRRFLRAVKKAGKRLAKDELCREFLRQTTEELELIADIAGY